MSNLETYKKLIKSATTKQDLKDITYKAFLEDNNALSDKRTLYDKVVDLCIKKEEELS